MPSYLITGSSRGIGLALVTELLQDPANIVLATARNPSSSSGLQDLKSHHPSSRLHLLTLDVSSPSSIASAAKEAAAILPNGLDTLISNAGVNHQVDAGFEDMDLDLLRDELSFNTVSIVDLIRSFLPLIREGEGKKLAIVTSQLGSIEIGFNLPGLANAYSISKAALNMTIRKWSALLRMEGITAFMIHPGWVETEIGNGIEGWMSKYAPQAKQITTEQSAKGVLKVTDETKAEDAGAYYNVDGSKYPF